MIVTLSLDESSNFFHDCLPKSFFEQQNLFSFLFFRGGAFQFRPCHTVSSTEIYFRFFLTHTFDTSIFISVLRYPVWPDLTKFHDQDHAKENNSLWKIRKGEELETFFKNLLKICWIICVYEKGVQITKRRTFKCLNGRSREQFGEGSLYLWLIANLTSLVLAKKEKMVLFVCT